MSLSPLRSLSQITLLLCLTIAGACGGQSGAAAAAPKDQAQRCQEYCTDMAVCAESMENPSFDQGSNCVGRCVDDLEREVTRAARQRSLECAADSGDCEQLSDC